MLNVPGTICSKRLLRNIPVIRYIHKRFVYCLYVSKHTNEK